MKLALVQPAKVRNTSKTNRQNSTFRVISLIKENGSLKHLESKKNIER